MEDYHPYLLRDISQADELSQLCFSQNTNERPYSTQEAKRDSLSGRIERLQPRKPTGSGGAGSPSESNAKHWCFTSFADAEPCFPEQASYAIWQRERAPDTGRLHWQGYIEFKTKKRRSLVQKLLGDTTAHMELRKGTRAQAIAYSCKKESRVDGTTFTEHGVRPDSEESKSQIAKVAELVRDGASIIDIATEMPSAIIRYDRGIKALINARDALRPMSYRAVRVLVISGRPGCGKTKWCYNFIRDNYDGVAYNKTYTDGSPSWWDGYAGQRCVLIDDFEGQAPIEELLHLLGGYGHCRNYAIKGGFITLDNIEVFIFTTNNKAEDWYRFRRMTPVKIEALMRRITHRVTIKDDNVLEYVKGEIPIDQ